MQPLTPAEVRRKIILDYAKWTALSALRSGAPVKKRKSVYPLLDAVAFDVVLTSETPITSDEFNRWHEEQTLALCNRDKAVPVGWAVKMINVYLKTAVYVGNLGRPDLVKVARFNRG